jgi:hypothetical protein
MVALAVALAVAGVAAALVAATTTPFSWQADAITAVPIGGLALAVLVRWPRRAAGGAAVDLRADGSSPAHPWVAWVVLAVAVVAWELVQYAAPGSRGLHPTLSSMADAVDRAEARKAAVFFLWLCLGAAIVRAGTAVRVGAGPAGPGPAVAGEPVDPP